MAINKRSHQSDFPGDFNLKFTTKILVHWTKEKKTVFLILFNECGHPCLLISRKGTFFLFSFSFVLAVVF